MAQLIKPGSVKVVTNNNGEVTLHITLDLNVNLNSNNIQVSAQSVQADQPTPIPKKPNPVPKNDDWLIPDFSASPKVNFGK
jgi:hypothetical protein